MSISWSLAAIIITITITATANTTITTSFSALTTKRPLARSRHLLFRFRWPFYFFLSLTFIACQQRDRNELLCQFVTSNCCNNFPLDLQTLWLVKTGSCASFASFTTVNCQQFFTHNWLSSASSFININNNKKYYFRSALQPKSLEITCWEDAKFC